MADGDSDYSLMSSLRSSYPNVPIRVVLKVIDTCNRDFEKCKQILDVEQVKYPANEMKQTSIGNETPHVNNDAMAKVVPARIKELQVSHEPATTKPNLPDRHVSTYEKSVVNIPHAQESKGPVITKSISYTDSNTQFSTGGGNHLPSASHTAPPDFAPFFHGGGVNQTNIPNITCKTFNNENPKAATANNQPRPSDKPLSSTGSPGEQRRPVKVINIPPGSLSGGSVSPAGTPSNSRHFRMNFGDTGGTCTVQTNHPAIQRHGSTPNVSQHFRSEYRAEASVPQSIHSSSIVVAASSHSNQPSIMARRLSGESATATGGEANRPPTNPFHFSPSVNAEYQPSPGAYVWEDGCPLSTPVQASSPGISHSRPVFMKDFNADYSQPSRTYNEVAVAGPSYNYMPQNYTSHISTDYPSTSFNNMLPLSQEQNYPSHYTQPKQNHQGYHSPPSNLNIAPYNTHFNSSAAMAYPIQMGGASQPPRHYGHFTPLNLSGVAHNPFTLPRSPNPGLSHPRLSNRTNSSESEHQDADPRHNHFSSMGSRVSSQSSVGSDSSMREITEKHRSESIHEETETGYIRALLQHQRDCFQKLSENAENHRLQLINLRSEVIQLERGSTDSKNNMYQSFPSPSDIAKLCEKNRNLQTDIQFFINEIEMYKSGHTLFNNINPHEQQNFYANMPTGQQDCNFAGPTLEANRTSSPSRSPPPRPPPPIPVRQRSTEPLTPGTSDLFSRVPPVPPPQPVTNSGDSEEGEHWNCSSCTFKNHPALKKCEICDAERYIEPKPIAPNSHLPSSLPHRTTAATTAEWVGGVQRSGHHQLHQHHRAGT